MERKIIIRKSQHFFEKNRRFLKTVGLALLILSIPLTVYVLNQVQDIRQRAAETLVPITSNFPKTACTVNFTDVNESTNQTYKVPVLCLNAACITQGYGSDTTPPDLTYPAFGGEKPLTRKFAVAFITHYHVYVLKDWTMKPSTGTVFKDMPAGIDLGEEVETAVHYKFINGDGSGNFFPEDPWAFGFHGIWRKGSFDNNNATPHPAEECWQGACYNFAALGSTMTRGQFLEQMYKYGIDPSHQDLKICMVAPTAPPPPPPTAVPPPPTATPKPIISCNTACTTNAQCAQATGGCTICKPNTAPAPIVDFTKLTGSSCPRNFASKLANGTPRESTYASAPYRLAAECLNKAYCVVQGFSEQTCPPGSSCAGMNLSATPPDGYLGGEAPTTRKFAVAFIARYRVDAISATDTRHWTWVTPTGNVFKDVPANFDLGREIETAAARGFVAGQPCNTVYDQGEPYYDANANVKCFDPEGNWIFGFKGVLREEYFNGTTPVDPWGTPIKRGDFLQKLYEYGTSQQHPDLAKCMSAPGTAGSCQPPAACNVGCLKDGDCAGAKDGCTVCTGATATTPGKCSPPPAACGSSCSRDSDCTGAAARDGCTSCVSGRCAVPFNNAACKCDGMDATAIGTGQAVTFSAFSKVEGTDVTKAIVKGVNIRVFRGGAAIQDQIAQSGFLPPTVIENTPTKVRYKTDWRYIVPADAKNGDLFRIQADIQCAPRQVAAVPRFMQQTEKGILAKVIDKITEPIRAVLGINDSPTPVPPKSLQVSSFYPGEIIEKTCNYFRFVIKR